MDRVDKIASELGWEIGVDYPEWGHTEPYLKTLSKGYAVGNETPKDAYWRVSSTIASRIGKPELAQKFFDYIWKNWLCLATPVLANTGTTRGLPISCYGIDVDDSIWSIGTKNLELMMLAKHGGGVGISHNRIRGHGALIKNNGFSEGTIPFIKINDSTIVGTSQGSTRRGAASSNINIMHDDFDDWIEMREPKGDINRQCLNMHHCVVVDDKFMRRLEKGDPEARRRWLKVIKKRLSTGEPYILYRGNVNKDAPEAYYRHNLKVRMTNICTEIMLYSDENHTFVCCLSSLNAAKFDEWSGSDLPYIATLFLEGVMEEFIQRAKGMLGFENAVRFAEKSRALGLGILGWHTFLQEKGAPFVGLQADAYTRIIFGEIKKGATDASKDLAKEFGEPLWCKDTGMRHTHLMAQAPTVNNSKLSGNVSPGIDPWSANVITEQSAKGTFIRKNPTLEKVLRSINKDTKEVWNKILEDNGSVQGLDFLSDDQKEVFLTAKEINQLELIRQAAIRQKYIDQGQSLNLFFPKGVKPGWVLKVHMEAWRLGIKSLYYTRTESVLRGDIVKNVTQDVCVACDG